MSSILAQINKIIATIYEECDENYHVLPPALRF